MAESGTARVLRRKTEQARASQSAPRGGPVPTRVLQDAVRKAGEEELSLALEAKEVRERHVTPAELLESLPGQMFLGVLLGPEEGFGLFCIDPVALAAVIEMRTMGRISKHRPEPRRPTRADAAMVVDLIDRMLAEFEAPLLETNDARWASGWRYQLYLDEPRPLAVLLEEGSYRLFEVELTFAGGAKEGKIFIALPANGRARARAPVPPPPETAAGRAAKSWARAMQAAVGSAEARIDVVLGRLRLTLGELARLTEGDRILLPLSALGAVRLMAAGGEIVGEGRLGQTGGLRAVRIADPAEPVAPLAAEGSILPAGAFQGSRPPRMEDAAASDFAPAAAMMAGLDEPLPGGLEPTAPGEFDSDAAALDYMAQTGEFPDGADFPAMAGGLELP